MELQREHPPAYNHHHSASLNGLNGLHLPDVPSHDPHRRASTITLPDIKSLGLPESNRALPPLNGHVQQPQWSPSPSQQHFQQPHHIQQQHHHHHHAFPSVPNHIPRPSIEQVFGSPMETDSVMSYEVNGHRAQSVMSIEDAETRAAAEALSGLKNLGSPDFMRSPSARSSTIQPLQPIHSMGPPAPPFAKQEEEEPSQEPILSLLTTQHPWIGGTITGSRAAYEATKYYSPAFVRSSAEFVERTIGTPLASTVEVVSRKTGVESGMRRYLGDRKPSDIDTSANGNKPRRQEEMSDVHADIEKGLTSPPIFHYRSRAGSQVSFAESLPAYDDTARSPPYEQDSSEKALVNTTQQQQQQLATTSRRSSSAYNWSQQLIITTSGLGVALSESSLRSLKYCLRLLKTATASLASVMNALKTLLAEYEGQQQQGASLQNGIVSQHQLSHAQEAASRHMAGQIKAAGDEIMAILSNVVNTISRYAGGALPDNASALVRRQLMSVPQRWRLANDQAAQQSSSGGADEALASGNRFLQFSVQSLDMFQQINMVLTETIRSAEKWLDSMGRRRGSMASTVNGGGSGSSGDFKGTTLMPTPYVPAGEDVVMQEKL